MQECQVACENILCGTLHAKGGGHPGGRRQVIGLLVISAQNNVLCGRSGKEYFLSNRTRLSCPKRIEYRGEGGTAD